MNTPDRPPAPSRLTLAISAVLIVTCAFAAFWVSTTPGGSPPPAIPALSVSQPDEALEERAPRRIYVPLSPLAQGDVESVSGVHPRPGDWLRMDLPATLPPAVRISSLPITIPLRPGFFAEEGSGYDQFALDEFGDLEDGALPLLWIAGEEDSWLTPNFRVADFASNDGGTTARISYRLVDGLERLRERAGSLGIISGYRNVAHNAAVGGVAHSQHLAGKAADVWSGDQSPLDLARLALQTLGCEIGLGLGPRSLHIDVRGSLLTWSYPGAAMPNAAFDAWALAQCGLPVPPELAQKAAEAWMSESAVAGLDTLYADASPTDLLARFHTTVMEAARAGYELEGPGAVVLDLRAGVPPTSYLPPSYVRYVTVGTPDAEAYGVTPLIQWRERGRQAAYFVYAVLTPARAPAVGVSSFAAVASASPSDAAPAATAGSPAPQRTAPPSTATLGETWSIVVASHMVAAQAEALAQRYRAALRDEGYVVSVVHDRAADRYRVTAGQFRTSSAAESAVARLGAKIPSDAWLYRR